MDVGLMVVFCIIEVVHINVSSALLGGIVEDGISCAHEEQAVVENHPERFAYGFPFRAFCAVVECGNVFPQPSCTLHPRHPPSERTWSSEVPQDYPYLPVSVLGQKEKDTKRERSERMSVSSKGAWKNVLKNL